MYAYVRLEPCGLAHTNWPGVGAAVASSDAVALAVGLCVAVACDPAVTGALPHEANTQTILAAMSATIGGVPTLTRLPRRGIGLLGPGRDPDQFGMLTGAVVCGQLPSVSTVPPRSNLAPRTPSLRNRPTRVVNGRDMVRTSRIARRTAGVPSTVCLLSPLLPLYHPEARGHCLQAWG
jgi:hypothetical protein